jgi:hypothetical protein
MHKEHDFWYAVNLTEVVLPPKNTLETFGASVIKYHVISEFPDEVNRVRIRSGKVHSERPQIITPGHFAQQILDGFGEKAREYADWLQQHNELVQILKYGIQFRKEQVSSEESHAPLQEVVDRVKASVENDDDPMSAVVVGADDLWEVSLLKFLRDFIEKSAPSNVRDFRIRQHESSLELQREIEMDFRVAQLDRAKVAALGDKLQRLGLFEKYEDRFYSLLNS